jgi:hypothetical protein
MTKQKPVHDIKICSVRAAIWSNPLENGRVMYSVTFSRLFKDEGGWKDAQSFSRSELLTLCRAAELAFDWIVAQPSGETPQVAEE